MGAGTTEDHYIQDAAELYWVYIIQKELQGRGKAIHEDGVLELETEFNEYCGERCIIDSFNTSEYKLNMDQVYIEFVEKLFKKYPGKKLDIKSIEVEYRNLGLKGDFMITLDDGKEIPISLKNYRGGYESIQLCSGTWHSIVNNFSLEEASGPGMYTDCDTGLRYRAQQKCLDQRNRNYEKAGLKEIPELLKEIDDILVQIKEKYIQAEDSMIWDNIKHLWVDDCKNLGNKAIDIVIQCLDKLPKGRVLNKFLEKTDLCHKEELLLIGPNGKMMCSLFNQSYKTLLEKASSGSCSISYFKHGKSLRMSLLDNDEEVLHIDIPFTLQKNGAWYIPKERYEGLKYHKGEKIDLLYGQRRPKKSKEINTSTNMWFKIGSYIDKIVPPTQEEKYKIAYDKGYKDGYAIAEYNKEGYESDGYEEGFVEGKQEREDDGM